MKTPGFLVKEYYLGVQGLCSFSVSVLKGLGLSVWALESLGHMNKLFREFRAKGIVSRLNLPARICFPHLTEKPLGTIDPPPVESS